MQFRIALIAGLALVALAFTWGFAPALTLAGQEQAAPAGNEASPTPSAPAAGRSATAPTASRTLKAPTPIVPNGSWPVYHRNDARTGSDPTLLHVSTVSTGWTSAALDEQIYASPVIYGGIVYAATLNNSVYALNQTDGSVVWQRNLGAPETGGWGCGDVSPQGILGTPAIDPTGGRIYVAAQFSSDDVYHVYGLNLATGAVELNTPIPASIGTGFDWTIQQERGALAVANGHVYVPFGGRAGDCGSYSGWVVGVPTSGSTSLNVYQTPGIGNGIWSGGGVVVDDSTGSVIATTGNGDVGIGCNAKGDGSPQYQNDAVVRLSPTLAEQSFFMPPDWQADWCSNDQDLGSTAALLISPTLLFQAGKHGTGFLLNPTSLGGVNGQLFPAPTPYTEADVCGGNTGDATFGSYAYSAPYIYVECDGVGLAALRLDTSVPSKPSFSPCDSTCAAPDWLAGSGTTFGPHIVAGGAVWVANDGGGLFAYRADTGAPIYQSAGFGINRFSTPAEAGGQVFVASHTVIRSFGMHFGASQSSPAPSPPARPTPVMQANPPPTSGRPPVSQSSPQPPPFGR
jgi:outer membrane protein assembly factor BamB